MVHPRTLAVAALLLTAPLAAQSAHSAAHAQQHSQQSTAHITVKRGRAVLIGGGTDAQTIRRSESFDAHGRAQLEVSAGSQVHVGWMGTMSVDVFGPASFEWSADGASVDVVFGEFSWVDVESRRGDNSIVLPAEWHASFSRASFHLRGLAGGPTEVRHNAGQAVTLDWRGGAQAVVLPPVSVLAGSSIRLDRPRVLRKDTTAKGQNLSWSSTAEEPQSEKDMWPWREVAETEGERAERQMFSQQTQDLNEMPGQPGGHIERIRTFEADGTSRVRTLSNRNQAEPVTSAQAPIAPSIQPRVEVETRPTARSGHNHQPRSVAQMPKTAVSPVSGGVASNDVTSASNGVNPAPVVVEEAPLAQPNGAKAYDRAQWRGLDRTSLNGSGVIAAEKGEGVEVRILGGGRTKVFVSGSSTSPRWCFTPFGDYLMHPGAVAVFEKDGALRMSFGTTESFDATAGRPRFSELR